MKKKGHNLPKLEFLFLDFNKNQLKFKREKRYFPQIILLNSG